MWLKAGFLRLKGAKEIVMEEQERELSRHMDCLKERVDIVSEGTRGLAHSRSKSGSCPRNDF
jgi:hypothetical protein